MTSELIERLEKAESGSRELDREMAELFGWQLKMPHGFWLAPKGWKPLSPMEGLPYFTTSLDAIVSLIGEKLPGWTWAAGPRTYGEDWDLAWARIYPHRSQADGTGNKYAKTVPLALCIALLRAIQASQGSETDGR